MFRILSLDGGGARGAFISGFLSEIERITQKPISNYFDLITGSSTGGVIAILLAAGQPMSSIEHLYSECMDQIFVPYEKSLSGILNLLSWAGNPLVELLTNSSLEDLLHSKYQSNGIDNIIGEMLKKTKLTDINNTRIAIPAVNLTNGEPTIFKTPHLPEQDAWHDVYALDVIRATTAAPCYFDPIEIPEYGIFCDGGLWANNPGIVGYSEAIKIARQCRRSSDPKFNRNQIYMLSIGTGYSKKSYIPNLKSPGIKWWSPKILELMIASQSRSTCAYLQKLMAQKFVRINFHIPENNWIKLDNYHSTQEMSKIGKNIARQEFPQLAESFFSADKKPFLPFI